MTGWSAKNSTHCKQALIPLSKVACFSSNVLSIPLRILPIATNGESECLIILTLLVTLEAENTLARGLMFKRSGIELR